MTTGDVTINIQDGGAGAVQVPASNVQLVIGCSSAGTATELISTRSAKTLFDSFSYGPLAEAAALSVLRGGTVLAMRAATNTAGAIVGISVAAVAITAASSATPIVITAAGHGLVDGSIVTIASVGGNTAANGTFRATVLSSSTFSLDGSTWSSGAYTSGGTVQFKGVVCPTYTGTSVPTASGAAYDDANIEITVAAGGTIGAAGILLTVSLDAGRSTGPNIPLGTASSYAIPGTNVTIAFAAGTLVTGNKIRLSTTAPSPNTAGIAACLAAFLAGPYGTTQIGSVHFVGVTSGTVAAALQSGSPGMDQLAAAFNFTRLLCSVRDAATPAAWGGVGETEAAWMTSILADFSATSAKRIAAAAGHMNCLGAYPNPVAGLPVSRRPLGWGVAARQVAIPTQRHSGRVRQTETNGIRTSGALEMFVIDPTNDPRDGFIYHDERVNPGLDILTGGTGRFTSARTRIGNPGWFVVNPLLLSPPGSDFDLLPKGLVMDTACSIVHQVGQLLINSELRLNNGKNGPVGTIFENEARAIENELSNALNDQMIATSMISSATVVVDRTNNIATTSKVRLAVRIVGVGYALEEIVDIGFQKN